MAYFRYHPCYSDINKNINYSKYDNIKYEKEIGDYFNNNKIDVFEIGFGNGKFANYLKMKSIKNYTGIDIDGYFIDFIKPQFNDYQFKIIGFEEFLNDKCNKYDIVFTSHVFEHLDNIQRKKCIKLISDSLKKGGIWINYMPNAQSILDANRTRYFDIDHKYGYTPNSFQQLLNKYGSFSHIFHKNSYVGASTKRGRIIHHIFLFFTKIYYLGMLTVFPDIYTSEFISIIKK